MATKMNSKRSTKIAVFLAIFFLPLVISYSTFQDFESNGVISDICAQQIGHNDSLESHSESAPLYLSTKDVFYLPGTNVTINVMLTSIRDGNEEAIEGLQGFALAAWRDDSVSGEIVGSWIPQKGQQTVPCGSSMVVINETNSWKYLPISFDFVPPATNVGIIEFRLSAVYNATVYWENLEFDIRLFPPEECKLIDCSNEENEADCQEPTFQATTFEFSTDVISGVMFDGHRYYQGITRFFNTCVNAQLELWINYTIPNSFLTNVQISAGDGSDIFVKPLVNLILSKSGNGRESIRVLSSGPSLWLRISAEYQFYGSTSDVAYIAGGVGLANVTQGDLDCEDNFKCQTGVCIPWSFVCDGQYDCSNGFDENWSFCTSIVENEITFDIAPTFGNSYLFGVSRFFRASGESSLEMLLNIFVFQDQLVHLTVAVRDETSSNETLKVTQNSIRSYHQSFAILSAGSSLWLVVDIVHLCSVESSCVIINGTVQTTNYTIQDWSCGENFHCSSQLCIPQSSVCDGSDDCPNGNDERSSSCTETVTNETTFIWAPSSASPTGSFDNYHRRDRIFTTEQNFQLEMIINFTVSFSKYAELTISVGNGVDVGSNVLVDITRTAERNGPQTIRVLSSGSSVWISALSIQLDDDSEVFVSADVKKVNASAIVWSCHEDFDCGEGVCISRFFACNSKAECSNGADEGNCTETVYDEIHFNISSLSSLSHYGDLFLRKIYQAIDDSQIEMLLNFHINHSNVEYFLVSIGNGKVFFNDTIVTLTIRYIDEYSQSLTVYSTSSELWIHIEVHLNFDEIVDMGNAFITGTVNKINFTAIDNVTDDVAFNVSSQDAYYTFDWYDFLSQTVTRFFETDLDSQLEIEINLSLMYDENGYCDLSIGEGNSLEQDTLVTLTRGYVGDRDQIVKVLSNGSTLWVQISLRCLVDYLYQAVATIDANTSIPVIVRRINSTLQGWSCDGNFDCNNGVCLPQSYICDGKSDCSNNLDEDISVCTEYIHDAVTIFPTSVYVSDGGYGFQMKRFYLACNECQLEISLLYEFANNELLTFSVSIGDGNSLFSERLVELSKYYVGDVTQNVKVLSTGPTVWLYIDIQCQSFDVGNNTCAFIQLEIRQINTTTEEWKCGTGLYSCMDGTCIPQFLVCDGKADCTNTSIDETARSCLEYIGCNVDMEECSTNGTCYSTNQNYSCKCVNGFERKGMSCEDIDECYENIHYCHSKAICSNTVGNYSCQCLDGYQGDGFQCADSCTPLEFSCNDGTCIPGYSQCDGIMDCYDKEDELGCNEPETIFVNSVYVFSSPSFSHNFLHTWYFHTDPGMQLLIKFSVISIDSYSDFIYVRDCSSISSTSHLLLRWTGEGLADELRVLSSENVIWVTFEANERYAYDGFNATVEITNMTREDMDCGEQFDCNNGVCLPQSSVCDERRDCGNNADESYATCKEPIFVNSFYLFNSPNFPSRYPDNFEYTWYFYASPGWQLLITFTNISTESHFDFIYVREDSYIPTTADLLLQWSGESSSDELKVLSSENVISVTFESDGSVTSTGFNATVEVTNVTRGELDCVPQFNCGNGVCLPQSRVCDETRECGNNADEANEDCTGTCDPSDFSCNDGRCMNMYNVCDGYPHCSEGEDESSCSWTAESIFVNSSYFFNSPNFPSDYSNNFEYTWYFYTDLGSKLLITFIFISSEPDFDLIYVRDCVSISATSHWLLRWSGAELEDEIRILSSDNIIWVTFSSDSSDTFTGFNATIEVTNATGEELDCGEQFDCGNGVCLPQSRVCDERRDCGNNADETNGNCTDIDECSENRNVCHRNATCQNTIGNFTCQCLYGYQGDGFNCTDIDECSQEMDVCQENAVCLNTDGSFSCQCQNGFEGNGTQCSDIDECLENTGNCHENALCANTEGSFSCNCRQGFEGNGTYCTDIDECSEGRHDCHRNASCLNTIGNYTCECFDGYQGDGFQCNDIDECSEGRHDCHRNASCLNTIGNYTCECFDGYQGDGFQCNDTDECFEGRHDCHRNESCLNTIGNYTCECLVGYQRDRFRCKDIDECSEGRHDCHSNANCLNTIGNYNCECFDGYQGDGFQCNDIDECFEGRHDCHSNASCLNTIGNYTCKCFDGYQGNGFQCNDIDECFEIDQACDSKANCFNEIGYYICQCLEGYQGDGFTCSDIDECLKDTEGCHEDATCTNTNGSFYCTCRPGFEGSGTNCKDVDECSEDMPTDDCDSNANCINTIGNYTCQCLDGYQGDGSECSDVDECSEDMPTHDCDSNANCINTIGNYTCQCLDGYQGDGSECSDVDECSEDMPTHDCDSNANCINAIGNYTCQCLDGYQGDGSECSDIDECSEDSRPTHDCNSNANCINTIGNYTCQCLDGYQGDGSECSDIDECSVGDHVCDDNANCSNAVGTYTCQCLNGYEGDGFQCMDIDECLQNTEICHQNATCTNTDGSFTCNCQKGFQLNGTHCIDIDECLENTGNCHENAVCTNTEGSFNCTCRQGFEGNGTYCTDVNECAQGSHGCHSNANCSNAIGSYSCTCIEGYQGDGFQCRATRTCDEDSDCEYTDTMRTEILQGIVNATNISIANVAEVARDVASVTVSNNITKDDLDLVVIALATIVEVGSSSVQVTDSVLATVSNVMNVDNETVQEIEQVAFFSYYLEVQVALFQSSGENYTEILDNIAVVAVTVEAESLKQPLTFGNFRSKSQEKGSRQPFDKGTTGFIDNVQRSETRSSITLPSDFVNHLRLENTSAIDISFTIFGDARLFPIENASTPDGISRMISTQVISASVNTEGAEVRDLPEDSQIYMTFFLFVNFTDEVIEKLECVYWKFTYATGQGTWSTEGCVLTNHSAETSLVTCRCNHLTSFAVMVHVSGEFEDNQFFAVISTIGCVLSICGLLGCVLAILLMRSVRKKQQSHVHINLCLGLVCFYLTFLFGVDRTSNPVACRIIASLIHYFCLVSVAWTSVEAFTLYKYIWEMRRNEVDYLIRVALVFGWGFPAVPALLVFFLDDSQIFYDGAQYCFLQTGFGLYFGFLLELVFLVVVNCVFYVLVTYRVTCRKVMAKNAGAKRRELITRIKSVIFFWVLLGLSWIFGFVATIDSPVKIAFQILFSLLLALQGVGMFYMLVVQNNEMRKRLGHISTRFRPSFSLPTTSKYSLSGSGDKGSTLTSSTSAMSSKDSIYMRSIPIEKYTPTETVF